MKKCGGNPRKTSIEQECGRMQNESKRYYKKKSFDILSFMPLNKLKFPEPYKHEHPPVCELIFENRYNPNAKNLFYHARTMDPRMMVWLACWSTV
jgi:hypothetical protein